LEEDVVKKARTTAPRNPQQPLIDFPPHEKPLSLNQEGALKGSEMTLLGAIYRHFVDNGMIKTAKVFKKEVGDDLGDASSENQSLSELFIGHLKRKASIMEDSDSDSDSSSGSSTSASSSESSSSSAGVPASKKMKLQKASSGSDSSSDSDSDSSSDNDSGSDSSDEGSSSDSSSGSDKIAEANERVKRRESERNQKAAEAAAASLAWKPKSLTPNKSLENSPDKVSPGFRRVDAELWSKEIVEGLEDNSYEKAFGNDGYGAKASAKLMTVRGKDFRHEKTKKKRGSYRGGEITLASNSFKYE
jgi:hypothetical protein